MHNSLNSEYVYERLSLLARRKGVYLRSVLRKHTEKKHYSLLWATLHVLMRINCNHVKNIQLLIFCKVGFSYVGEWGFGLTAAEKVTCLRSYQKALTEHCIGMLSWAHRYHIYTGIFLFTGSTL